MAGATGIAVFAHGSTVESANEAVRRVAGAFAARGYDPVEPCFLELGEPGLAGAVAQLVERGAARILVVPYFLTLGKHLQRDLPRLVTEAAAAFPGLDIQVAEPLDGHPALVDILAERADAALRNSS